MKRILTTGLLVGALALVGGCTTTSRYTPTYSTPPAIVQTTPVQTAPYATPPVPVPIAPPGAIVVPAAPTCPSGTPQPYVPH